MRLWASINTAEVIRRFVNTARGIRLSRNVLADVKRIMNIDAEIVARWVI